MALIMDCWGLDGLILMIVAIAGIYMYMTRKFLYWKKRGVLEIPPIAFVGNFAECLLMRKSPGEFVKDLYDQSANLSYMGFYIFDKPIFMVRDPELIKHVLVRDFNYFVDRYAATSPDDLLGRANLFIVKNPAWKVVRSKLSPIFTSAKLKMMFELMLEVGQDLQTHLNALDLKGEGRTLEMKELWAKYSTDLIGTTAYGLKVNSLNNPDTEFRRNGREIFKFNLWRSMELTSLFFAPQVAKPMGFTFFSTKSENFLRQIFWDMITDREKSGIKRNDLIDLLIELKNDRAGSPDQSIFKFDGDNLVAQASVFFTAGFETSATTISFTLYELALAPKIQTRLREEIKDAREKNDGKITYDMEPGDCIINAPKDLHLVSLTTLQVTTIPYLDMVVSETLRKYPTLPFLDRVTNADYKVPNSNIVLEKGMPVYIPMLGLHYDPEYFPKPEVFDPDRFTDENKKNRKAFVYMPFGNGPHNCIGQRLGLLQTKLGIIHILSDYELSPCKDTLIPMKLNSRSFLTTSDGGLYLNVRKITPPSRL